MIVNEKGFAPVVIIGIVVAVLAGGTGTVVVSDGSKPGDVLYGLDRATESVQQALALTDTSKKDLYATLAVERLNELQALYDNDEQDDEVIAGIRSEYEAHKAKLADLSDDDGSLDDHENELKSRLELKKTEIEDTAESAQKVLETEREALKQQYEQAVKAGDTTKATELNAQISGFEDQLKAVEQQREAEKQQAEEQNEAAKQEAEDDENEDPEVR